MFAEGSQISLGDDLTAIRIGVSHAEPLRRLAHDTYYETFASLNTPENMQAYLESAFNPARVAAELSDPRSLFFLVEQGGETVGYIKLVDGVDDDDDTIPDVVRDRPSMLVERFYIVSRQQGKGVAKAMMQFCLEVARHLGKQILWLGVWEANPRAMAFYRKWGFKTIGTHVFTMGDDAQTDYWMMRELEPL